MFLALLKARGCGRAGGVIFSSTVVRATRSAMTKTTFPIAVQGIVEMRLLCIQSIQRAVLITSGLAATVRLLNCQMRDGDTARMWGLDTKRSNRLATMRFRNKISSSGGGSFCI